MDALGLTPPEGKATIGTNGGVMEAWMLSASTADAAGGWIAADVRAAAPLAAPQPPPPPRDPNAPPPPPAADGQVQPNAVVVAKPIRPILLMGGDDALVLDTAEDLLTRITVASAALAASTPQFCRDQRSVTSGSQQGGVIPLAAIGAIAGLLKSDTEISGVDVPIANRMLVAATERRLVRSGITARLPSAAVAPDKESPLALAWGRLLAERDSVKACRPRFAAQGSNAWVKKTLAAMDQQTAAIDALEAAQTKADDKGVMPLARAIHAETLLRGNPWVLRVSVEKGGGSILKRSNVWTALGAPAIGISGGLVVSYTLTEPTTGAFLAGGALVCRTALTNIRDVQAGRTAGGNARKANCAPLIGTSEPPNGNGELSR